MLCECMITTIISTYVYLQMNKYDISLTLQLCQPHLGHFDNLKFLLQFCSKNPCQVGFLPCS